MYWTIKEIRQHCRWNKLTFILFLTCTVLMCPWLNGVLLCISVVIQSTQTGFNKNKSQLGSTKISDKRKSEKQFHSQPRGTAAELGSKHPQITMTESKVPQIAHKQQHKAESQNFPLTSPRLWVGLPGRKLLVEHFPPSVSLALQPAASPGAGKEVLEQQQRGQALCPVVPLALS